MGGEELTFVHQAFESNWIAPLGPNVDAFEKDLQSYLNCNAYVAALSTGTAAIHLALLLLGVTHGDEVICQSFTFSASANPITYLGATPIFIDSEEDTWNLCPIQLERAIKDRIAKGNKPKAIIAVHLYGMPFKVDEILAISKKYDIPLIEDSAEALGSTYNNKKCGSFGEFSIFSFNGNKIITTSGGGALVCRDEETKNKAIFFATQARDKAPHYQHSKIGFNYRLSNISAGIGRGQMLVLDSHVAKRRSNFNFYKQQFQEFSDFKFLDEPINCTSNRWLTCVIINSFQQREKLRLALENENIECRPLWKPMHLQPVFKNYPSYTNGVSTKLFEKGLCLPSGSNLTESDLERIVDVIKKNYCYDSIIT